MLQKLLRTIYTLILGALIALFGMFAWQQGWISQGWQQIAPSEISTATEQAQVSESRVTASKLVEPEFDGVYLVSKDNQLVEVRKSTATRRDPAYAVGGGYCTDLEAQYVSQISYADFKGVIVKDANVDVFTFIYEGTQAGCVSAGESSNVRKKALSEFAYYAEPVSPLKVDQLYVVWINRQLWFFQLTNENAETEK